jgi:hypothetical protein
MGGGQNFENVACDLPRDFTFFTAVKTSNNFEKIHFENTERR